MNPSVHHKMVVPKRLKLNPATNDLLNLSAELSKKKKLSESEKDQIDNYVKQSVRSIFEQIKQLESLSLSVVEAVKEADKKNISTTTKQLFTRAIKLFDPRSNPSDLNGNTTLNSSEGYKSYFASQLQNWQVVQLHFDGISWWLNKKLMEITRFHIKMEEHRLKSISNAYSGSKRFPILGLPMNMDNTSSSSNSYLRELPESEQQQLLEENKRLFSEFEKTSDEVMKTQKAIIEISTLQSQMSQHLANQLHQTEQFYNESLNTLTNLEAGNTSLRSSQKNLASARRWVLFIILLLSFVLLFLDWFD
ncbi:hypothetical protein BB560_005240 [Smittium megazygosporum]|uniref:t-SNARE coiled-coil homology domain-containing protein n=1 Tax=Smittium megazygosporum TaxID=133381 RepID=A0A2T9Z704_9FUNG|nr:hypothetical protein BB560_005240 [Smittium megazygosporum]